MFWMNSLVKNQLDGSDKYDVLSYQDKVKALTVKDLQDVAKKYLTKGRVVAMLMTEDGWEKTAKADAKVDVAGAAIVK